MIVAALIALGVFAGIAVGVLLTLHATKSQREYVKFRANIKVRVDR
jgi:uncharacterized membrane protein